MKLPDGVAGILLDLEGTTTPLDFVGHVLFPFARERLAALLASRSADREVAAAAGLLRAEWESERAARVQGLPEFGEGAPYARFLMDRDRKSTGLKALQGLIWQEGYASGALRGELFEDVPPALAAWREAGLVLAVFSSGSALAQRLLLGHTAAGDLTGCISGWFDTRIGAKREPASYAAIARTLALAAWALLFLSDVPAELDAAREAGLRTGLVRRPGNPPVGATDHPQLESFASLLPGRRP